MDLLADSRRIMFLASWAVLVVNSRMHAEGIHGGTAPVFRPTMPSERGTIPSIRSELPSLRDGVPLERWETPSMPVPRFPSDVLPSRPSFADPAIGNRARSFHSRGAIGLLPSIAVDAVAAEPMDAPPPIYLEMPDRPGGPRRIPAAK